MDTSEHMYEIIASGDKILGKVWWDESEKQLASDNLRLLTYLKKQHYQGLTYHDGVKFLQHLGRILKNGYVHARKVEN